jgi:hypothetical protein
VIVHFEQIAALGALLWLVAQRFLRWGQNLSLFMSFRGIYEPCNYSRKIIGFGTFSGFPSVSPQDGTDEVVGIGAYGVTPVYEKYLESILDYHEKESPLSHLRKYELVKGDACVTLKKYLEDHPETIIALAYFDFDIYEPTRTCLELIRPNLGLAEFHSRACQPHNGCPLPPHGQAQSTSVLLLEAV